MASKRQKELEEQLKKLEKEEKQLEEIEQKSLQKQEEIAQLQKQINRKREETRIAIEEQQRPTPVEVERSRFKGGRSIKRKVIQAIITSSGSEELEDGMYKTEINSIGCADDEEIYVALKNAIIPHTFLNVGSSFNQLTLIEDPDGTADQFTVTIQAANYNTTTLLTALKTKLNDNSPNTWGYTTAYDSSTGKIAFATEGKATFLSESSISTRIGLTEDTTTDGTNTAIMPSTVNLVPVRLIKVRMRNLAEGARENSDRADYVLDTILIDSNPFEVLTHIDNTPQRILHNEKLITNIEVALTDNNGNNIDFNGEEWTLVINFFIEKINRVQVDAE